MPSVDQRLVLNKQLKTTVLSQQPVSGKMNLQSLMRHPVMPLGYVIRKRPHQDTFKWLRLSLEEDDVLWLCMTLCIGGLAKR